MPASTIDGLSVNHETTGAGPAVVLLHGWGGCIASMGPLANALRDEYTVVSVDLPGFGASAQPAETWGSADYARCIAVLLRELGHERVLAVVGHSFGGKVALHLALQEPGAVGSLVLVGTPAVRLPLSPKVRRRIARVKFAKKLAKRLPGPLRAAVDRRMARLGSDDYRAAGSMRDTLVRSVNEDMRDLLGGVSVPTLLVWGAADVAAPPEIGRIMESEIAGSGLVVLDGSGHFPYLDEPLKFNAVLRSFLASMRGKGE
ncbi:MAG: alpha/beta hydrolase [Actinobacteria bacterium]|nr:MAG: alpha/beta hydrolase [Actinomycetota bacterium]